jgi:hypothetical protein
MLIYHHLLLQVQASTNTIRPPPVQSQLQFSYFRAATRALERERERESKQKSINNVTARMRPKNKLWVDRNKINSGIIKPARMRPKNKLLLDNDTGSDRIKPTRMRPK